MKQFDKRQSGFYPGEQAGVWEREELLTLLGSSRRLEQQLQGNHLISIGGGFYRSALVSEFNAKLIYLSKYLEKSVISGFTALRLHGLMGTEVDWVEAQTSETDLQPNHLVQLSCLSPSKLIGATHTHVHGYGVLLYDIERALICAYQSKVNRGLFYTALTVYLKNYSRRTIHLQRYNLLLGGDLITDLTNHQGRIA